MVYLDNDAFLVALAQLFEESKNGKSLFITMKRHDGRTKPRPKVKKGEQPPPQTTGENCCLMRATTSSKKISTIIYQKDMNRFNQAYANVIKLNIDGLKKREKRSGESNTSTKPPKPTPKQPNATPSNKTKHSGDHN